jgi:hypothetical protein
LNYSIIKENRISHDCGSYKSKFSIVLPLVNNIKLVKLWKIRWALKGYLIRLVRGKYVWSRDIYLGDHWGDLATIGEVGLNL